jgi:hypothetical protein
MGTVVSQAMRWLVAGILVFCHTASLACADKWPCQKCPSGDTASADGKLPDKLRRFYDLHDLIEAAYGRGDFPAATTLAKEYLEAAELYRCDWNYGNAVHDGNRFLGLVSLNTGDSNAAATYLAKAGKSGGSPQLNTFGPRFDLANELLKQGQIEPVKAYLKDIKRFWEMDNGQVEEWLGSIDRGEMPDLSRRIYKPGLLEIALFSFVVAWPALVVASMFLMRRRRLTRPWAFIGSSLIAGYVAIGALWFSAAFWLPPLLASVAPGLLMPVLYASAAVALLVPILVVVGVSRLFSIDVAPGGGGSASA